MTSIEFYGINHDCVFKPVTKEGKIAMYKKLIKYGGKCPICEKYGIWKKPSMIQRITNILTKPLFIR